MTYYIFSIILLIVALIAIDLRKIYHSLPKNEIRIRARNGDQLAKKIYHAVAYEDSLEVLLWFVILISAASSLILLDSVAPTWLNFIAIVIYLGLAFAWLPRAKYSSLGSKLAIYLSPCLAWILNYIHPLISKALRLVNRKNKGSSHTGIYDRDGLNELLKKQRTQEDSRISTKEIELLIKSLDLAHKKVIDYQKNWTEVVTASSSDLIGPVLLDELHKSDQHFIPVVEEDEVVGVLDMSKLDISSSGEVKDHMDKTVHHLDEEQSLLDALKTIRRAPKLVYIVKDNQDNSIGIISLTDILNELIAIEQQEDPEDEKEQESSELDQKEDNEQISEPDDSELETGSDTDTV